MMDSCGWCMRYYVPCLRARKADSVGALMQPLRRIARYWKSQRVFTVMCTSPPTHWFSDPPFDFSIFQIFFNDRCIHKEFIFKGCIHFKWWFLEFYFIFRLCYPILLNAILMIWYVWSILIPCLIWILSMLRSFIFVTSWKV